MKIAKLFLCTVISGLLILTTCGLGGCAAQGGSESDQSQGEAVDATQSEEIMNTGSNPEYSRIWEMGGREEMPLDALSYHATWDEMVDREWVQRELLGNPVDGDEKYPMYIYHMNVDNKYVGYHYKVHDGALYERPKILITSGFHGAEKAAPVFLRNVIHDMMTDPEFSAIAVKYEWDFVPLVNPWGYSHSMLKDGVLQDGFEYDTLEGYEIVENGEYNQGIRLNEDGLNLNRKWHDGPGGCPSSESKLLRDVVAKGDYDLVLDMHETHNISAYGFASIQRQTDYISEEEYKDNAAEFYTAVSQAGIVTDQLINRKYGVDESFQASYTWVGSSRATFRNYAAGYTDGGARIINHNNRPKYSICLEVSIYCPEYAKEESDIAFNKASNTYGNTFVHYFIKQLDNLL